jgi:hypothetical protein
VIGLHIFFSCTLSCSVVRSRASSLLLCLLLYGLIAVLRLQHAVQACLCTAWVLSFRRHDPQHATARAGAQKGSWKQVWQPQGSVQA